MCLQSVENKQRLSLPQDHAKRVTLINNASNAHTQNTGQPQRYNAIEVQIDSIMKERMIARDTTNTLYFVARLRHATA